MYEALIERINGEMHTQMKQEEERVTCIVSQEIGYKINTEELIKALQYDRNQYEKGFKDGVKSIEKEGEWETGYGFHDGAYWKCTNCNELIKVKIPMHYCNNCGAKMIGKYPYGSDKYKELEE